MTDIVPSDAQTAELVVQSDAPQFRLSVRVTPSGLLAIAGLVQHFIVNQRPRLGGRRRPPQGTFTLATS